MILTESMAKCFETYVINKKNGLFMTKTERNNNILNAGWRWYPCYMQCRYLPPFSNRFGGKCG